MSSHNPQSTATPLILACSGGSNVGQITNQAALELTREGLGKMFCLAGLGGDIAGIIKAVREADGLIVLDGCALGCAKAIMERAGLPLGQYLVATDLGIEKVKDTQLLVRQEDVDKLKAAAVNSAHASAAHNQCKQKENTMNRQDVAARAEELFRGGLHCAESVFQAVLESQGLAGADISPRVASAFGGGVGRSKQELCGALSGGLMALGRLRGRSTPQEPWDEVAATAEALRLRFATEYGGTRCADVLEKLGPQERMDKCIHLAGRAAGMIHDALAAETSFGPAKSCGCCCK